MFHSIRWSLLAVLAGAVLLTPVLADLGTQPKPKKNFLGVRSVSTPAGVEIIDVLPNTPAAKAGLKPRDLILKVDGFEVGLMGGLEYPLQSEIRRSAGESKFLVKSWRTGKVTEVVINLREEVQNKKPEPPKAKIKEKEKEKPKEEKKPAGDRKVESRPPDDAV